MTAAHFAGYTHVSRFMCVFVFVFVAWLDQVTAPASSVSPLL